MKHFTRSTLRRLIFEDLADIWQICENISPPNLACSSQKNPRKFYVEAFLAGLKNFLKC